MNGRKRGFTLVELLVVVAIIALLAALIFPVLAAAKERARVAACQSNLKQLSHAFHLYMADWEDTYPLPYTDRMRDSGNDYHKPSWKRRIFTYVKSPGIYGCPSNDAYDRMYEVAGQDVTTSIEWEFLIGYAMNDEAFNSNRIVTRNRGAEEEYDGYTNGGPLTSGDLHSPAEVILLMESQSGPSALPLDNIMATLLPDEWIKATYPPHGSALFTHYPREGRGNWLFCDGSVRHLRVIQTIQPKPLWFARPPADGRERYYQEYMARQAVESLPPRWK